MKQINVNQDLTDTVDEVNRILEIGRLLLPVLTSEEMELINLKIRLATIQFGASLVNTKIYRTIERIH